MKLKRFRDWKDQTKVLLIRMWAAGAVCFFAAWGRTGAEEAGAAYSLNLIIGLIVLLILSDWIIVIPIAKFAFNVKEAPESNRGAAGIFLSGFLHIMKISVIIIMIVGVYYVMNRMCIAIFQLPEDAVPVPLEPFLFGLLYGVFYYLLNTGKKILRRKFFMPHKEPLP